MSLVNITDFDAELRLLGLYEREVMKTGILDYPALWPLPQRIAMEEPLKEPPNPEPLPEASPTVLPETIAPIFSEPPAPTPVDKPCQNDAPAISQPVNNVQVIIEADEWPVPVSLEAAMPEQETKPEGEDPVSLPCPLEARRQALLTEQEMERRLFYIFAEELERTGDLRKFPAVLRPSPRTSTNY